jgi:hypothetical protein
MMNFSKRDLEMITYLAGENKLELKIWNYKGKRSIELHEKTSYSMADQFNCIIAENVKTLKECKRIASDFLNYIDQFGQYETGFNLHPEYVTL